MKFIKLGIALVLGMFIFLVALCDWSVWLMTGDNILHPIISFFVMIGLFGLMPIIVLALDLEETNEERENDRSE